MPKINEIAECATEQGLSLLSFLPRQSAEHILQKERAYLDSYQEKGYAGQMSYLKRDSSLYGTLDTVLKDYRSVVSLAWLYPRNSYLHTPLPEGYGRVASYAWRNDYHQPFKEKLIRIAKKLELKFDAQFRYRCFVDAAPILERPLAQAGAVGRVGRNGLFIRPGLGSYMFIGEIVSDLEVDTALTTDNVVTDLCKSCCRCCENCPTQALVADYTLDARRCISYLSIEKRGMLAPSESLQLGEWLWGCDICQACCPYNTGRRALPEDSTDYSAQAFISLRETLKIREEREFLRLYQGSAFMRGGRQQLLRNACCVAANTHALSIVDQLITCGSEDSSAIVRQQAMLSLGQLKGEATGIECIKIDNALAKLLYRTQKA
ncbi:MAG: tRNA epoxyqueuosine(34) reductase QueG [Deltaproteobacteria bacterium]|nr:tRNA epoxyqueuosine(34) reductase QueG [Deltaproteobacteria bacterium]